jgi:hypothetical protein
MPMISSLKEHRSNPNNFQPCHTKNRVLIKTMLYYASAFTHRGRQNRNQCPKMVGTLKGFHCRHCRPGHRTATPTRTRRTGCGRHPSSQLCSQKSHRLPRHRPSANSQLLRTTLSAAACTNDNRITDLELNPAHHNANKTSTLIIRGSYSTASSRQNSYGACTKPDINKPITVQPTQNVPILNNHRPIRQSDDLYLVGFRQ